VLTTQEDSVPQSQNSCERQQDARNRTSQRGGELREMHTMEETQRDIHTETERVKETDVYRETAEQKVHNSKLPASVATHGMFFITQAPAQLAARVDA
jgi:hypothetical protein